LVELTQSGCQSGVMLADDESLDALVSEGLRNGALAINGRVVRRNGTQDAAGLESVEDLDGYLRTYGPMLGKQAERSLEPLHVPGREVLPELNLLREPFEAQAHVIE